MTAFNDEGVFTQHVTRGGHSKVISGGFFWLFFVLFLDEVKLYEFKIEFIIQSGPKV